MVKLRGSLLWHVVTSSVRRGCKFVGIANLSAYPVYQALSEGFKLQTIGLAPKRICFLSLTALHPNNGREAIFHSRVGSTGPIR